MGENAVPDTPQRYAKFHERVGMFISKFWKSLIVLLWPIILLPLPIIGKTVEMRCLYVVCIMAIYWVTEVLPLPVTAMLPVVLFPTMGILDSNQTCAAYMKEVNMMFLGGLMIAVGVQQSKLPKRVALKTVQIIGCSHRKLHFGLSIVTMFISMWVSNSAATTMMTPIVEATLEVLEQQGLGDVYKNKKLSEPETEGEKDPMPSNITICYYLGIAYSATIGGLGTLVGTATNGAFKGIYESDYPDLPSIDFLGFMLYSIPWMLLMEVVTYICLQVVFMGMFRPNSSSAKQANLGGAEALARAAINEQYRQLGPLNLHETSAGILFIVSVFLYVFRSPGFIPGWADVLSPLNSKDSVVSIVTVILMFMLPMAPNYLKFFKSKASYEDLKSTEVAGGIVSWKALRAKIPWELMFLLGGGFALAEGSKASGLSKLIGNSLKGLKGFPPYVILLVVVVFVEFITEFTSNAAIANLVLPVLSQMAVAVEVHPLYLMLPACLACSMAMLLPVGTPPNAIVAGVAHIPTKYLVLGGLLPKFFSIIIIWMAFPLWGRVVYPDAGLPFKREIQDS